MIKYETETKLNRVLRTLFFDAYFIGMNNENVRVERVYCLFIEIKNSLGKWKNIHNFKAIRLNSISFCANSFAHFSKISLYIVSIKKFLFVWIPQKLQF